MKTVSVIEELIRRAGQTGAWVERSVLDSLLEDMLATRAAALAFTRRRSGFAADADDYSDLPTSAVRFIADESVDLAADLAALTARVAAMEQWIDPKLKPARPTVIYTTDHSHGGYASIADAIVMMPYDTVVRVWERRDGQDPRPHWIVTPPNDNGGYMAFDSHDQASQHAAWMQLLPKSDFGPQYHAVIEEIRVSFERIASREAKKPL